MTIICNNCKRYVPIENKDLGLCASCNGALRDQTDLWPALKKMFLKMAINLEMECPRCHKPVTENFDVHHKRGKTGYADAWAKSLDIPLLLDVRWLLAVDRVCHTWIEGHRAAAEARGWSLTRLGIVESPIPEAELEEIYRILRGG